MRTPIGAYGVAFAAAFLAPFLFPWLFTRVVMLAVSFVWPPFALLSGGLTDLLYYQGHGVPYGLVWGAALAAIGFFVRRFVKTRIM